MPEGHVVLLLVDLDQVIEEWLMFKNCRVKHNESTNMFEGIKKYLF